MTLVQPLSAALQICSTVPLHWPCPATQTSQAWAATSHLAGLPHVCDTGLLCPSEAHRCKSAPEQDQLSGTHTSHRPATGSQSVADAHVAAGA